MATYIKEIMEGNGDIIYPQTRAKAIYTTSDNKNLELVINKLQVVSEFAPSEQSTGNIWYREVK